VISKRVIAGAMLLALFSGLLISSQPAQAASTTILLATVKVGTTVDDQYFQLSNNSTNPLTLNNWQVCTSRTCDNFSTTVANYALGEQLKSAQFPKWRAAGGLKREADLLCIKDNNGVVVDCINWGAVDKTAANYTAFATAGPLFDPGLAITRSNNSPADFAGADKNSGILIYRRQTVKTTDSDKLADWKGVTVAGAVLPIASAVSGATPAATVNPSTNGGQATTQPATGAEFPIMIVAGLLLLLLLVRYLRNVRLARSSH